MITVPKDYIIKLAKRGLRMDKRKMDEYRKPITVEYGVSSKSAEGSARVTMGDTIVVAGVKLAKGEPYPDKQDEGTIMVNAEMLPLSSPEFEPGPPGIDAIELSRVVDRGIRESHSLDFKKLCIKAGESIWLVMIDIYPINAAGNLFDAAALAAMAALKDTRFPKLEENGTVNYKERTDTPLPLSKTPISCTMYQVGGKFIVDPLRDEELASDARLTVAITEKDEICAMQKGGEKPLSHEEVHEAVELASRKTAELRQYL